MVSEVVGDEALESVTTFAEGDNLNLQSIMDKFEEFCIPKRNVTDERQMFHMHTKSRGNY